MYPDGLFGTNIHLYGVCIAIGILLCFLLLWRTLKHTGVTESYTDAVTYFGIAAIVIGFVSAALFQAIYDYIENPQAGFDFDLGHITFIGGLIGGVITFVALALIFRKKFPEDSLWDIVAVAPLSITIAHGFGRIGCFFAGCCYGMETGTWLDVYFPALGRAVLPTQLYEAVFLLILCAVLCYLLYKKHNLYTMPIYLISYGVWRFIIEYIRDDQRGELVSGITPSQFFSIVMILIGIGMIFLLKYYVIPKNKMLPKYKK